MVMRKMDKQLIFRALRLLAEYTQMEGICLEIGIYGGTAMMLAYNNSNRDITKDIDAAFKDQSSVAPLIQKVADDLDLHENWMNEEVRMFLAETKGNMRLLKVKELEHPNLIITVPTASYLLAMKCRACREPLPGYAGDYEDITFLLKKMEIQSVEQIQEHIDRYFVDEPLSEETRIVLSGILKAINN